LNHGSHDAAESEDIADVLFVKLQFGIQQQGEGRFEGREGKGAEKVNADEYSGSKFKVFAVYDIDESAAGDNYNRKELLFELGTNAPLRTIFNQGFLAPSEQYFNQIMDEIARKQTKPK
jgi:hypothetical protein